VDGGSLRAVLWDADGVLQRHGEDWVAEYAGFGGVPDGFIEDVWAAEVPLMVGGDFPAAVAAVAERYDVDAPLEALLSRWRGMRVVTETAEVVTELRAAGVGCYLATNQNPYRCAWMREHLDYAGLLDGAFYSCELGAAKPTAAFFGTILTELDLAPEQVGFVDDNAANVEAATALGIRAHQWHYDCGPGQLEQVVRRFDTSR
jgi:putative hydrolase of the HAD superfamily